VNIAFGVHRFFDPIFRWMTEKIWSFIPVGEMIF
jgi:hypothetical protein